MTAHPHQAGSDESDPDKQSTPAGVVGDLEETADELDTSTEAAPPDDASPQGADGRQGT